MATAVVAAQTTSKVGYTRMVTDHKFGAALLIIGGIAGFMYATKKNKSKMIYTASAAAIGLAAGMIADAKVHETQMKNATVISTAPVVAPVAS